MRVPKPIWRALIGTLHSLNAPCIAALSSHLLSVLHITVSSITLPSNHSTVYRTGQARSFARATYLREQIALHWRRQTARGTWHLNLLALCVLRVTCAWLLAFWSMH